MEYISVTDTAKMIRAKLKRTFPGVKFSVRSSKYSGGSSIDVSWTDGPTEKLVEAYVNPYQGSRFDGMIDMKYSVSSYILPDGNVAIGNNKGTGGQMGSDPGYSSEMPEGAVEARFVVDFIFCNRAESKGAMERAMKSYATRFPGNELAEAIKAGQVAIVEDDYFGWKFEGNPDQFEAIGSGSQYGGSSALRAYAARRMSA